MSPAWASVEAMKRVPIHTPCAPSAKAAARPRPSTMEPAASTGIFTASTICGIERQPGDLAGMAAGLGALGDHGVEAAVFAGLGVAHGAADVHHLQPRRVKAIDEVARRHAEAGDEGRRPFLDDDVGGLFQRFGDSGEQVDAERFFRERAHAAHLLADFVGAAAGHAERAEAAGLRHRGAEFGVGDAAHAGEQDRVVDAQHVANGRADGHGVRSGGEWRDGPLCACGGGGLKFGSPFEPIGSSGTNTTVSGCEKHA